MVCDESSGIMHIQVSPAKAYVSNAGQRRGPAQKGSYRGRQDMLQAFPGWQCGGRSGHRQREDMEASNDAGLTRRTKQTLYLALPGARSRLHVKAVGTAGGCASKSGAALRCRLLPAIRRCGCPGRCIVALPAAAYERLLPQVGHYAKCRLSRGGGCEFVVVGVENLWFVVSEGTQRRVRTSRCSRMLLPQSDGAGGLRAGGGESSGAAIGSKGRVLAAGHLPQ